MRRERGFTLIELLIVVAIIGILAAIAIPNLLAAMHRARQKRTMQDMRTFAYAWESRAVEIGTYASAGAGVSICCTEVVDVNTMATALIPTYAKNLPRVDAWKRPYDLATDAPGHNYVLWSYGKDGIKETSPVLGPTGNFDCDLIYSGGEFIQYPEGVQTQ